jgi:AraC-like DNA-binding protein
VPTTSLDTTALAPQDREPATRAFLETFTDLDSVGYNCAAESALARIRTWDMQRFKLHVTDSRGLQFGVGRRSTREAVCIGAQISGHSFLETTEYRVYQPGEVSVTDFSRPYQWSYPAPSTRMMLLFNRAELGLPANEIHAAAGDLSTSPLYELFQTHLLKLYGFLEQRIPASASESLGSSTLELARAVIATVDCDDLPRNRVANEALLTRVEAYVQQNLKDPTLSPESIAQAHYISVRQLYKLWSAKGISLAEWIMTGRLEGVRHSVSERSSEPIGTIGRQWGFTSQTHLGRRFKAAYGLSPRDWQKRQEGLLTETGSKEG